MLWGRAQMMLKEAKMLQSSKLACRPLWCTVAMLGHRCCCICSHLKGSLCTARKLLSYRRPVLGGDEPGYGCTVSEEDPGV